MLCFKKVIIEFLKALFDKIHNIFSSLRAKHKATVT